MFYFNNKKVIFNLKKEKKKKRKKREKCDIMINKDLIYNCILFLVLGIIIGVVICIIFPPNLNLFNSKYINEEKVINFCKNKGGLVESREDENGFLYKTCVLPDKEIEVYKFYVLHSENNPSQPIYKNYEDNRQVCPAVCVPMWKIQGDRCVYDECGSGCGPNNKTTFDTKQECLENI